MKVKLTTKLDKAINSLTPSYPVSLNKKVSFFLEEGYQPDELGYLHKNNRYIKLIENGIAIVNKDKIWKNGVVIDKNIHLLHIDD